MLINTPKQRKKPSLNCELRTFGARKKNFQHDNKQQSKVNVIEYNVGRMGCKVEKNNRKEDK